MMGFAGGERLALHLSESRCVSTRRAGPANEKARAIFSAGLETQSVTI
jgi:hypothetical protein